MSVGTTGGGGAALGLLLDLDGPVASPVTRTLAQPSIAPDLVALLAAGVPVVFNTGRSDTFVRERVLPPMVAAGLGDVAGAGPLALHAVCEKGAVWASTTTAAPGRPVTLAEVVVDHDLAVPDVCHRAVAALAEGAYRHLVEVDATKRSMATLEAHRGVDPEAFAAEHAALDDDLLAALRAAGLGVRQGLRDWPDADGRTPWRIDPSVIATDVESVALGKDLGARRALALMSAHGPLPRAWCTVGDSATDYLMADQLHALGHDVTHVDVRPHAGGRPAERPYPVVSDPGLTDDDAGAALLARLADAVRAGRTPTV